MEIEARPHRGLSLAGRFLIANLLVLTIASIAVAAFVGIQLENGVLSRTAAVTALYIESFVEPELSAMATSSSLPESSVTALDTLISSTRLGERIVSFRVWSPDGTIVYSPNRALIGQHFEPEGGLVPALQGDVSAEFTNLQGLENSYERERWSRLVETYVPVRERGGGRIIAVTEFYQLPDEIDAQVGSARIASWAVVAIAAILSYLALAGLVKQGSDTIDRQQSALRERVAQLTALLNQNERLRVRLQGAADRTTTLNEAGLRRIGSDLHDGPAQTLALALLRLDELEGGEVVSDAVASALADLRLIASGLRSPSFEPLAVSDAVQRGVREHEQRTGQQVGLKIEGRPPDVPVVVKIGLYRVLQEALSNALRHASGAEVDVTLAMNPDRIRLEVADRGAGFDPAEVREGALGVAGMRERAQLLGGEFRIERRQDGPGTRVSFVVPVKGEGR
jgi:signal transduction histidine kinase